MLLSTVRTIRYCCVWCEIHFTHVWASVEEWFLVAMLEDGVLSLLCAYSAVEASNRIVNGERKTKIKKNWMENIQNDNRVKWRDERGKKAMKWKRKCIQASNGTNGEILWVVFASVCLCFAYISVLFVALTIMMVMVIRWIFQTSNINNRK